MKRALLSPTANGILGLASLLLGCSVDNPGMSNPAQPVPWDGPARTGPRSATAGTGAVGAGTGGGALNPGKVYYLSQFFVGNNFEHWGLFDVESPTELAGELGHDDGFGGAIRPTDGAFIYTHRDHESHKRVMRIRVPDLPGSEDPESNDIPVDLPPCESGKDPMDDMVDWWLAPDTGEILFTCIPGASDSTTYTYASGASFKLPNNFNVLAIGYDGTYFVKAPVVYPVPFVIVTSDGNKVDVAKGPLEAESIRATSTGFMLLEVSPSHDVLTRWQVAFDGSVVEQVVMPKLPPPYENKGYPGSVLDGQGRAVKMIDYRAVLRVTPDVPEGEILYQTDGVNPRDLIPSALYTGP